MVCVAHPGIVYSLLSGTERDAEMSDDHSNMPRFFVEALAVGQVRLPDDQAHHAADVLRLREGAEVVLFDGRGGRATARLMAASRRGVTADVTQLDPPAQRPSPRVHLGFAVPKGKRLDWLLEKATELGAASLTPVVFHRSVAGGDELSAAKLSRWRGHCISAAKQCGLDFLPEVLPHQSLGEHLLERCDGPRLLGEAGPGAQPLTAALAGGVDELRLLVGPEGGLTEEEHRAAADAAWYAVRLGATTLRIETAAVALLAVAMAMGEPPGTHAT